MRRLAGEKSPSGVEAAKGASRGLRGSIHAALSDDRAEFAEADAQILKFHGIYQQEDRDRRQSVKIVGGVRRASFMVRTKIPGGVLTPSQYLVMDRLADDVVYNRSLRITTRQNFQLHGVLKGDLEATLRRVNEALLTTFCACGDVERNIVAPPAPLADAPYAALRSLALELADALVPATRAYHEIWLDGRLLSGPAEDDPIYRDAYLPRKFKTGLGLPDDDSVEVHDQDVGLVGLPEEGDLRRLNVLVGGGTGFTHRREDTYARLASPLGSIDRRDAVSLVRTIAQIFRDYGDRSDRRHARLKYVVEENGVEAFREEVRRRADFALDEWVEIGPLRRPDWLGPHDQGDGRHFYGLAVPSGRILDDASTRLKTALATLVERIEPDVVLTPTQSILLAGLSGRDVELVERVLSAHRVALPASLSPIRRFAMSCPALPTCGLALGEAERVMPEILGAVEAELARLGRSREELGLRVTGCPNGCARPYNSDLGLVGRKPDHYDIYVGGTGERLAELYEELVPLRRIVPALRPLLEAWASNSAPDEPLGAFYDRRFAEDGRRDLLRGAKGSPASIRVAAATTEDVADGKETVVSDVPVRQDENAGHPR